MGTFGKTLKQELELRKEEKRKLREKKKEEKAKRGSLLLYIADNMGSILAGLLYSVLYLVFVYCVVLFVTLYLPSVLNVIISYFNANEILAVNAQCALLFFTAWAFLVSYVVVKMVTKFYIKRMRTLFPKSETHS